MKNKPDQYLTRIRKFIPDFVDWEVLNQHKVYVPVTGIPDLARNFDKAFVPT